MGTKTVAGSPDPITIPSSADNAILRIAGRQVRLTNLRKPFWPELGVTKGDLLRYYADVAPLLLPHIKDRPMVMRRYPNGAAGKSFFMKEAPSPRPDWVRTHPIDYGGGKIVNAPVIDDLPSLLWLVNLGCIDLNQWYARCDDLMRPDYLHFDLDPGEGASFAHVRESGQIVREALETLGMTPFVKTSGSRGVHVYVAIVRGPEQDEVLTFARALATELAARHSKLMTVGYRVAARPKGRVVIDYKQNAWGQTLASIYSVRPRPRATVSTPITWDELAGGATTDDFRIDNVRKRFARTGDLWKGLLARKGRTNLARFFRS